MAFEYWNWGGLDLSTAVRVCSPCLWLSIVLIVMVRRAGQGGTQSCDVSRRCHFHARTRSLWQIECKLYNKYIAVFRPAHVLLRPRSCSLRKYCLQVAEQQGRLLGRPCDVILPARYRDYLIVKRNYNLHRPENVVSAAKVNYPCLPQCLNISG